MADSAFTFRNYAEESLKTDVKERTIHLETASEVDVFHLLPTSAMTPSHAVIFSYIQPSQGKFSQGFKNQFATYQL